MSCSRLSAALLLGSLLAAACGGGESGPPDADPIAPDAAPPDATPACAEAAAQLDPTFEWIQTKILDKSCNGFDDCHKGAATEAGDLNLEAPGAHAALVNADSDLAEGWKLVVPGDVEDSYLMVLLGLVDGPIDPDVGNMPGGINPLLCVEKQEAVGRWVAAGANP